jgi:hypothetical protein
MEKLRFINLLVMRILRTYKKIVTIMDMKNPIAPMIAMPKADILEIDLNSWEVGFLRRCQTLTHFSRKGFSEFNMGFLVRRGF